MQIARRDRDLPARRGPRGRIAALMQAIRNDHYAGIIGQQQIEYSTGWRLGPDVIRRERVSCATRRVRLVADGAEAGPMLAGFARYMRGIEPDVLQPDSLYVRTRLKRTGWAARSSLMWSSMCSGRRAGGWKSESTGATSRRSQPATAMASPIRDAMRFDIRHGFFMDDYLMSRDVGTA